jgi:hypothetical protein
MANAIPIQIVFADENAPDVMAILAQEKADQVEAVQQFGAVGIETLIVAVIVAEAFASLVCKITNLWKCGVIVDARGTRIVTKRDCDLPRGSVLILNKAGEQHKLERPSESDIKSLIGQVG